MFFEKNPVRFHASAPIMRSLFLCLTLLLASTNSYALYFDREPDGFASYTSSGIQIKTLFDNKEFVQETLNTHDWQLLNKYYKERGYEPVWCGAKDQGYSIKLLLGYLQAAHEEGLNPRDYAIKPDVDSCSHLDESAMAQFDIALTNAFFKYSKDISSGRLDPKQVDEEWHIKREEFDPILTLDTAFKENKLQETLATLPPQHKQYRLLREKLARLREVQRNRSWPFIPPGRTLKPGTVHPHISLVRRRLASELNGSLHARNEQLYDNDLKIAVESFQKRHGLEMDGLIGPGTKQALNMSSEWRIKQIETSMERWRWMPKTLGDSYILVNVPGFEMSFIKNDRPILNMRTITGRKDRTSPSFQSKITQIIFNPTWTVPTSIAIKDLLPQQLEDPNFFYKSDIEVFMKDQNGSRDASNAKYNPQEIDWSQFDEKHFPYLLVQKPGDHNSLGRIKFQTPNEFGIYLHDTPYRHFFSKRVRAFSSGCIRLEKPEQLAAMLLGSSFNPTPESANKVVSLIEAKETIQHDLTETVPVYVIYMTTWIDKNGKMQFRDDIYDRDSKISNSLFNLDRAG
jgi:murein L,D-transpeptidase YcbB/YkuD